MRVEVEATSTPAASQTTTLASAGTSTLTIDLSPEQGGSGRGFSAAQLLCLSIAGAVSNALQERAAATHTEITHVTIRVRADFPDDTAAVTADGPPPTFEYDVELAGNARTDRLNGLLAEVDQSAPVLLFLRRIAEVRAAHTAVRSDFPRRSLDEALAVCRFMERWPGRWWVAGGWALDFWHGFATRDHEDVEIAVPRADQQGLKTLVADWQSLTPRDNHWAPMAPDEALQPPGYMWQLRRTAKTRHSVENMPPRWEFLLADVEENHWIFPHDPTLRLPLDRVIIPSPLGAPVAAPEVVLLLKAFHNPPRPKDKHDLLFARERFSAEQRTWLRTHLARLLPGHRWLPLLA